MATSPEAVRAQLTIVSTAAASEITNAVSGVALERQAEAVATATSLIVPGYYDAAASLAVAWYDEIRAESNPVTAYSPQIIGTPETDWIEREATKFATTLEGDLEAEMARLMDEFNRLAEKEVARGFRDTIVDNSLDDADALGWSRVARSGACKLCVMAADRGAVYSQRTAFFAAHTDCHCAARPEFRGGQHGPEASVEQYLAAKKRRSAKDRARLREYLNENYPDSRG